MAQLGFFRRRVDLPLWLALVLALSMALVALWAFAVASGRNPLPFPDRQYHVHSASSAAALAAMEDLLRQHGDPPRFRADTPGVQRTIFASGNFINHADASMRARQGNPAAALGLVVADPDAAARSLVARLRELGFQAESIHDLHPGLPISYVQTDALVDSVIVFRKHMLRMGQKPDRWTPRADP